MNTQDLIRHLELEYYSSIAADCMYDASLWDFLKGRGIDDDDIWEYDAEIGEDAGKDWPDWL